MTTPIDINRDQTDSGPEFIDCEICQAKGACTACKGSGRSGYFLRLPPRTAPPCRRCAGSGKCPRCLGKGAVLAFEPYILVRTESRRSTSISMAAFTVRCGASSTFRTRYFGGASRHSGVGWHGEFADTTRRRRGNALCSAASSVTFGSAPRSLGSRLTLGGSFFREELDTALGEHRRVARCCCRGPALVWSDFTHPLFDYTDAPFFTYPPPASLRPVWQGIWPMRGSDCPRSSTSRRLPGWTIRGNGAGGVEEPFRKWYVLFEVRDLGDLQLTSAFAPGEFHR
jgi:hypothetical protein